MAGSARDRGQNGYGGENGYPGHSLPFGYGSGFPLDGMQLDNTQQDFNQPSILSENESDLLGGFFADPDNPKASNLFSHFGFGMDGKVEGTGLGDERGSHFGFGAQMGTVDSSATLPGTFDTGFHAQANVPQTQFANHNTGWPSSTQPLSAVEAANALSTLSQDQSRAQMDLSNATAGSWGKMNIGGAAAAGSSESPVTSSSRHSSGDFMMPNNVAYQSSQYNQMMQLQQQQQQQQQYQHQLQQTGARARQPSLGINTMAAQGYQFASQAPHSASPFTQYPRSRSSFPTMVYGSDPNITSLPYTAQGYTAQTQGKEHNLMNLPLAGPAATNGHARSHVPNQRTYHMPGSRGIQSSDSSPGAHYGGLPLNNLNPLAGNLQYRGLQQHSASQQLGNPHHSDEDDEKLERPHPRKRRKSQMQREDEAEYQPELQMEDSIPMRGPKVPKAEVAVDDEPYTPVSKESLKRRRSTATAPASALRNSNSPDDSPSPSPGDASGSKRRHRDSKSRSNLTDDQKRQNHILSEQKRRNVIKQGYHDLNHLVPTLSTGKSGLSKSEILKEVVTYLENVIDGNVAIMKHCGFSEDDLKSASETIDAH